MPKLSTRDHAGVSAALHTRDPFQTHGALSGGPGHGGPFGTGRLPEDWTRTYTARRGVIDYTVLSYGTPIAWHDREAGWIVPAVRYSVTTTKHQGTVRGAITRLGLDYQS